MRSPKKIIFESSLEPESYAETLENTLELDEEGFEESEYNLGIDEEKFSKIQKNYSIGDDDKIFSPIYPNFWSKYRVIKSLGTGSYGSVYLISDLNNNMYALKQWRRPISPRFYKFLEEQKSEPSILQYITNNLKIDGIPKYIDSLIVPSPRGSDYYPCMITEFINGTNWQEKYKNSSGVDRSAESLMPQFAQITQIVLKLHENHIAHRDIKPENIISSTHGKVYLVDFGSACMNKNEDIEYVALCNYKVAGSIGFWPPEKFVLGAKTNVFATDIFSLATTFFYCMKGAGPTLWIDGYNFNTEKFLEILKNFNLKREKDGNMTELKLIVSIMLSPDINTRPTIAQVAKNFDHFSRRKISQNKRRKIE